MVLIAGHLTDGAEHSEVAASSVMTIIKCAI